MTNPATCLRVIGHDRQHGQPSHQAQAIDRGQHAPHTLWQRRMKVGTLTLLVRLEWPGVLAVFDPITGDSAQNNLQNDTP
jgi:hypothetical protein